ncbi:MAG: SDR family NAD(P)-dependent oxidoreductase [Alphaproteobacteria bacterium]
MPGQQREVAIVTGAASGIGKATARRLASRGAAIGLIDRDGSAAEAVARSLADSGGRALAIRADVSDTAAVKSAVDRIATSFGGLDTVVAAAGIALTGSITNMSEADWHQIIAVNLTGTYLLARHTVPHLIARGGGSFVAISSDAGIRGSVGFAAYCASKHAVVGLVRCMALDYARQGVRTNAICPSFVDTPMADALLDDPNVADRSSYIRRAPMGRFAKPEEIANAIAHLSSPEASYTNGMLYVVDGATTAGTFIAD